MIEPLRLLSHVHGHLGWIAALVLVHPALLLGRKDRAAFWSAMTAVVLVTATIGMGAYLYGPFREGVRQPLFAEARSMGWLFERKEHMAFGAGVCTWAAALAHLGSCRARGPLRTSLRSWARWGYAVASVFAIAAAACATVVASVRSL